MSTVYCKFSNDRANEFKIKTIIDDNNGKLKVIKKPQSKQGRKHIEGIYEHYKRLNDIYADSILKVNVCQYNDNSVEFEYLEGNTLEEKLDELCNKQDYAAVIELLTEYVGILRSLAKDDFFECEDFIRIFGEYKKCGVVKGCRVSNIDLIPANIIMNDCWNVIDYEWTFDFVVPVDFIIYRGLNYYLNASSKRRKLEEYALFEMFGITNADMAIFERMERKFQRYVLGNESGMYEYSSHILKPYVNVMELITDAMIKKDYVQIYFDMGDGYTEENSIKTEYNIVNEYRLLLKKKFQDSNIRKVRIDPSCNYVMVKIKRFFWEENENEKIEFSTNGTKIYDDVIIFNTKDSNIEICLPKADSRTLVIDWVIHIMDEFTTKISSDAYMELCDNNTKLVSENEELCNMNAKLLDNLDYRTKQITSIENSRTWKIAKKFKKILGRD